MSDDSASQEVLPPQAQDPRGKPAAETPLGAYTRPDRGLVAADIIAIFLTGLWLIGVVIYFLFLRPEGQESTQAGLILSMLAIFLPIALIWIGSTVAKTASIMRQEAARLQGAIDAMRNAYIQQSQLAPPPGLKPSIEKKLDEIVASQKQTETAIATFATTRQARLPAQAKEQPALIQQGVADGDSQPGLALGTPPEALGPALSVSDFIGALNFPENENDAEGFRQLRRALADTNSGKLVRASQDVLTLLSQDGIYMDDLRPDRSRPELWRKFADGQRGSEISGIGGIHDRSGLALASGRMRSDPIFRDAVHHFLRQFDKTFAKFAGQASDDDIVRLSDTRTARAFMLLGRVAGTFD
ncbi:MAG: hypothetical protein OXC60_08985 [Litoreibacter sp.]|nr:hypothetical protein [Litoreibacter sp.]